MNVPSRALRGFVEADLSALIDIWVAAWRTTEFAFDFDARRGWLDERLRALRAAGAMIVVGLGASGRPAGFVTIDPRNGHLDQLCVAPAECGSGLAAALLDEAKRRAPGVVELEVNEANGRARRFYEREGFSVAGHGCNAASGLPTLRMLWRAQG